MGLSLERGLSILNPLLLRTAFAPFDWILREAETWNSLSPRNMFRSSPAAYYHFHAYMRTEEITTESGMRFSIIDPNHGDAVNAQTENFTGSHPWTTLDMDVTTGPETHFLLVRLLREEQPFV